jgi:hypothetical protein
MGIHLTQFTLRTQEIRIREPSSGQKTGIGTRRHDDPVPHHRLPIWQFELAVLQIAVCVFQNIWNFRNRSRWIL